jgi:hypothetical protein
VSITDIPFWAWFVLLGICLVAFKSKGRDPFTGNLNKVGGGSAISMTVIGIILIILFFIGIAYNSLVLDPAGDTISGDLSIKGFGGLCMLSTALIGIFVLLNEGAKSKFKSGSKKPIKYERKYGEKYK